MSRPQEEIARRITAVSDDDWAGFRREVLIEALDYEHAKAFLKPETTEAEWDEARPAEKRQRWQ